MRYEEVLSVYAEKVNVVTRNSVNGVPVKITRSMRMYNINVKEMESEERPKFLDMIPIKKYKHFTLYYKPSRNGNGYHECFLNQDIERYKTRKVWDG